MSYDRRVIWVPLLTAFAGACVGVGATLLTDRVRWHREARERHVSFRRDAYTDYLVALARWRNGLRETAYDLTLSGEQRRSAARGALLESGAYEKRMQMLIVAPRPVIEASEGAYKALRGMKDPISDGLTHEAPEYRDLVTAYEAHLQTLRARIREDLGVRP